MEDILSLDYKYMDTQILEMWLCHPRHFYIFSIHYISSDKPLVQATSNVRGCG